MDAFLDKIDWVKTKSFDYNAVVVGNILPKTCMLLKKRGEIHLNLFRTQDYCYFARP